MCIFCLSYTGVLLYVWMHNWINIHMCVCLCVCACGLMSVQIYMCLIEFVCAIFSVIRQTMSFSLWVMSELWISNKKAKYTLPKVLLQIPVYQQNYIESTQNSLTWICWICQLQMIKIMRYYSKGLWHFDNNIDSCKDWLYSSWIYS